MLKLITLNVERNEHIEKVVQFLMKENADVVCLQEVLEQDANSIAQSLKFFYEYMPMTIFAGDNKDLPRQKLGMAVISKYVFRRTGQEYYHQPSKELQIFDRSSPDTKRATIAQGVVWVEIESEGNIFNIANTHFTWTPNGQSDEHQQKDIQELFKITNSIGEVILCGDFNAPRGYNNIYDQLAQKFTDNIPVFFQTTLDVNLHRVKNNPVEAERISKFVVDYIFTTPKYSVSNVRQKFGVSDHTAIIGEIN